MIISVSRRCDIPRFRFDWFLACLDEGFVDTINPFNARQIRRVRFTPANTATAAPAAGPKAGVAADTSGDVFVFWTRDPGAVLKHGGELIRRGYRFYVMVTLTGYPALLEPAAPPRDNVLAAIQALVRRFGRGAVIWRYDPVFLSNVTDFAFHLDTFASLAGQLEGAVERVIVSVYDEYPRAQRRIAALVPALAVPPHRENGRLAPEVRRLLGELAAIARKHGIIPQSCAEPDDSGLPGVVPGACINGEFIKNRWGAAVPGKDKNQRPYCLCAASVDIGSYGSCGAGCVYCYAS